MTIGAAAAAVSPLPAGQSPAAVLANDAVAVNGATGEDPLAADLGSAGWSVTTDGRGSALAAVDGFFATYSAGDEPLGSLAILDALSVAA